MSFTALILSAYVILMVQNYIQSDSNQKLFEIFYWNLYERKYKLVFWKRCTWLQTVHVGWKYQGTLKVKYLFPLIKLIFLYLTPLFMLPKCLLAIIFIKNIHPLLHKKLSFPLRISSVNMTKSTVSCGFGHISLRNP